MERTTTRKLLRFAAFLAALLLPVGMLTAGPRTQAENKVTGLTFEETQEATVLHIGVRSDPTFSVFKLRNPNRLLVEVSDCDSAKGVEPLSLRNGVVDTAAISVENDAGSNRCRIIVSMDADARYDVDAENNEIVVAIDGAQRTQIIGADAEMAAELATREAELKRTKSALDSAETELTTLRNEHQSTVTEIARLETLKKELDGRVAAGESKAGAELNTLRKELSAAKTLASELEGQANSQSETVASLLGQVDALKTERDAAQAHITSLATERDHAARRAEAAETRASELTSEVERLKVAVERSAADQKKVDAANSQLADAETKRAELEKQLTALETEVAAGSADAEKKLAKAEREMLSTAREADRLSKEVQALKKGMGAATASLETQLSERERELKEAKSRATDLKKKSDEKVKELAGALAVRESELKSKEAELATLRKTEEGLRKELEQARAKNHTDSANKTQEEINDVKRQQARITVELKDEVVALKDTLAARESALARSQEREADLLAKYDALNADRLKEKVAVEALIKSKEASLADAKSNETALREELAALQSELTGSSSDPALTTAVAQAEAKLDKALQKQSSLNTEVDVLSSRLSENQAEVDRLKAQADEATAAAEKRETELSGEIARLGDLATGAQDRLAKAAEREKALQAEIDRLSKQSSEREGELEAEIARLESAIATSGNTDAQMTQLRDDVAAAKVAQKQLSKLDVDGVANELARLQKKADKLSAKGGGTNAGNTRAEIARLEGIIADADGAKARLRELRNGGGGADARNELASLKETLAAAEEARSQVLELRATVGGTSLSAKEAKKLASLEEKIEKLQTTQDKIDGLQETVARGTTANDELVRIREAADNSNAQASKIAKLETELERVRAAKHENADAETKAQAAKIAKLEAELAATKSASTAPKDSTVADLQAKLAAAETELAQTRSKSEPVASSRGGAAPLDFGAAGGSKATKSAHAGPKVGVKDIRFEKAGVVSRVLVELDGDIEYHTSPWRNGSATLVLEDASLPEALERKLDTRAFRGPVSFVSSMKDGGDVELVAEIDAAGSEVVRQDGNTLIWEFTADEAGSRTASAEPNNTFVDRRKRVRITAAEPDVTAAADDDDITVNFGKRETLNKGRLSRRRLTLDVRDADINDILRLIADEVGVSIITSPDVNGKVTLSLKSVPLDQALDIILRAQDLGMRQEGNIIWVAQAEVFREEQERELEAAIVREHFQPLEVRLVPLNYAQADQLQSNVSSLLSERGSVEIDPRTNTLIIKDVARNLDAAEILVDSLDTQTPQILIEARIVETQSNYTQEVGVQWGGDFSFSPANGNPTGLVFPSTIGVAGGSTQDNNTGTSANPNFAVNLPAAVGTGSGGALGFTFGSVGGAVNLNLRLSALEEKGFVKIISAPRVMTLDNVTANIESGTSIPVSVVSAAGAQTVFFDARLNLQVTPHVTRDGNIFLDLDVSKNEPDFGNTGAQGDPSIIRKEAHTQLLIPDGDTTVIGGIYTRNTAQGVNSVPFFGDIPFLGYFFKNTSESDNRTELLIFITPRIINRDASISASGPGSFLAPEQADEGQ